MSGTGVTDVEFSQGNVLSDTVTTATSGGDNVNVFKDSYVPAQTGGKSHRKMSSRKGKTMRKSKKGKKMNKTRKNTRRYKRK